MRNRSWTWSRLARTGVEALLFLGALGSAPRVVEGVPVLSNTQFLPGDAEVGLAVERQIGPRIAHGDGNYLAVWEDLRTDIAGWINTSIPLIGNETDIYAARMDAGGNILETLVVTSEGRNQVDPDVAFNGEDWLIVYMSQRPDWYFFDDIMAVRISGSGELLDPEPIVVRPENNEPANDAGAYPTVTSDGTNWTLVWADIDWDLGPNVSARRLGRDGNWIDPEPIVLHQVSGSPFGMNYPRMAFNGSIYMAAYDRLGVAYIQRFDVNLQPLDPAPIQIGTGSLPIIRSNGDQFLVLGRERKVYRIHADGTVLNPGGTPLPIPSGFVHRSPDAAWDGDEWVIVAAGHTTANNPDIYEIRMAADGTITAVAPIASDSEVDQNEAAIDSDGLGGSQVVWTAQAGVTSRESVVGAALGGTIGLTQLHGVSTGLPRQSYLRFATQENTHAAVFVSQVHGNSRILIQRVDSEGVAIDLEPTEVWSIPEEQLFAPRITVDGTRWVVSWNHNGSVIARRFEQDLTPVDTGAITILTDAAGAFGIAALGSEYYLAYTHTFSGDQKTLKGVRLNASDLSLIGSAETIGLGFANSPQVVTFAGRYLVVYEKQVNHDIISSDIRAAFVEPDGTVGPWLDVAVSGDDDRPDIAVAGDRALIVYSDKLSTTDAAVQARLLDATGAFLTGEVTVANASREQFFPGVAWTGSFFAVAWSDMRSIEGVEALRGDIYVARVDPDGNVLDVDGMQVSSGQLPEDLPAVAGANGVAVVGHSQLHGVSAPEVQRIAITALRDLGVAGASETGPSASAPRLQIGPNPFRNEVRIQLEYAIQHPDSDPGAWSLEVFSSDGRRIWRTPTAPGESRSWDGRDVRGHTVPGGVYQLRLSRNGELAAVRKLIRLE